MLHFPVEGQPKHRQTRETDNQKNEKIDKPEKSIEKTTEH
tara:strand:- start:581 stop:700 length:120 start_codon:yes stop_codon:yes gene_type:complete